MHSYTYFHVYVDIHMYIYIYIYLYLFTGISDTKGKDGLITLFKKSFRLGSLFNDMKANGIQYSIDRDLFVSKVITAATQV
jgi:hypothetical protein